MTGFWVLIGAHFILNEKVDYLQIFSIGIGFIGIVLIVQPELIFHTSKEDNSNFYYLGVLFVFISSLTTATIIIITRLTRTHVHWLTFECVTHLLALIIYPIIYIGVIIYNVDCNSTWYTYLWYNNNDSFQYFDIVLLFSIGLSSYVSIGCWTIGQQQVWSYVGSLILLLEVPLLYLCDEVIFNTYVNYITYIGVATVCCGILFSPVQKIIQYSWNKYNNREEIYDDSQQLEDDDPEGETKALL